MIVTVNKNGDGLQETYTFDGVEWIRIGLQNGTIEFNSSLWDYSEARLGFGDNFFDTAPYDTFPSEETRYIIRAINEEIPSELLIYRNELLILMFQYIVSETIESQNYLPWLNKTSFIDVAHTIRELLPLEVFQSDNQEFLAGYINEVKPYHVVIKDFLFKYTGTDIYEGEISDFDLPAQYNTQYDQYITPELVYASPSGINQYLPNDPIWQTKPYINWFNNQGLSITGIDDYPISLLVSYVTLNSPSMVVENIYGFPTTGTILVGTELISYSSANKANSTLSGLTRGVDGTTISLHLSGEQITINLPPVLLLNGGRGYAEPPIVTAYIDTSIYPEPRRAAIFQPVMNLDTILRIDVIDSGSGYQVLPEIIIEPSIIVTFASTDVDVLSRTITLQSQFIQTGDLVKYYVGADTTPIGGLDDGQYYYAAVLITVPFSVIALYTSYADAIQDRDRVIFTDTGSGNNNNIAVSAKASCISTAVPVRENNITLRFDRTSYNSQVTTWGPNNFYAGLYSNPEQIASSNIKLESTIPAINNILASAQGVTFEIQNVTNNQEIVASSFVRTVESTTASTDIITLAYDSTEPNASGSTIGFYFGMPLIFLGAVGSSNIVQNTVYYVKSILNESDFTISSTVGGSIFNLGQPIGTTGLYCYVGEVTNTAIVTMAYPGILNVTATAKTTNFITTPLLPSGTGGTAGFSVGLPVYFVGNVFGGIEQNYTYVVLTVINNTTFNISKTGDPLILDVTATTFGSNTITVNSTDNLNEGDPIIFTGTTFGDITAGQLYYVNSIVDSTHITISLNGNVVLLSSDAGSCSLTSQTTAVQLSTAIGSMTMNVGLPVSPGQVTGQQFTFYQTASALATNISGNDSNLIERATIATTDNGDALFLSQLSGGTTNMYIDMPFQLAASIGGLSAFTTYYVASVESIAVNVTSTNDTPNITCVSTTGFYVDMPVYFTGVVFSNIEPLTAYYIQSVVSSTKFTISKTIGGSVFNINSDNGSMTLVVNDPYITVSATSGGSVISLSYDPTAVTVFNQHPTSVPIFNIGTALGGYTVDIVNAGSGYTFDNTITILGTSLLFNGIPGASPANDLILTINGIDVIILSPLESNGNITSVIASGTPINIVNQYYLKVISATQCAVYSDPLMQVPVNGIGFPYTWKDYAFLPEPFYFDQSIVKYYNKLWQCVISNNDSEFDLDKWEFLNSDSRKLNELDRIVGYYKPDQSNTLAWNTYINMPGDDLTQLVTGITYPNATFMGNAFAPEDQYTIDTILQDSSNNTVYDVKGDPFEAGYGPEELVPGVISDTLAMIVTTRPGTNWDADIYQNVGFNVVSTEITPTSGQTEFSFSLIIENPASIALFVVDTTTSLGVRIYNYTVDWVNKVITLNTALLANHNLRIDLYEVGNGDQLVKSNSQSIPFVNNESTGFVEMPLKCNYTATINNGSGVIRPSTDPKQVIATETDSLDDGIVCDSVVYFAVNAPITFQGGVFGGITTGTIYYVKTINTILNRITVSTTISAGVAGPTFNVTSDTGTMLVNIQSSNGLVWTDPIVINNGTPLVLGEQSIVSETKSGTNAIVVNSTDHYDLNDPIVFSNAIDAIDSTFNGCGLSSQTTYFITSINGNEITVSATLAGTDVTLINATGIALCITNDYAITLADMGITATIVYANQYNQNDDFVVLSIFGETEPVQYGYTLPTLQQFIATAGQTVFNLSNYMSGDNTGNAIIEINGIRLIDSAYVIDDIAQTLTLTIGALLNDIVAVTSYNLTDRQYLNTQYITTTTSSSTFTIDSVFDQANLDRLWVTVNGYRIPSSSLELTGPKLLDILIPIVSGDVVIITSMMPTATPNQLVYMQMVDKNGTQAVFRANSLTRTWLTSDLQNIDEVIYVEDVTKLTETIIQYETAPAVILNTMSIPIDADKTMISQIIVYNNTTSETIDPLDYYIEFDPVDLSPILVIDYPITPAITTGDSLTITIIQGNLIYINGEQIRFASVDFDNNTLLGIQRGVNGTAEQENIPKYTEVYSLLSSNKLANTYINQSWNSFNYNPIEGDPLQISTTDAANFLNADVP